MLNVALAAVIVEGVRNRVQIAEGRAVVVANDVVSIVVVLVEVIRMCLNVQTDALLLHDRNELIQRTHQLCFAQLRILTAGAKLGVEHADIHQFTDLEHALPAVYCVPSVDKETAIRAAGALLAKRGYVDADYADAMVEREKLVTTYMGMGVAIPHGTSEKKSTVKKSGVVMLQYPDGVDFGDEKAYLIFGIAGVGDAHLDLLAHVCEVLEDEEALEMMKKTPDIKFVLTHLQ